MFVALMEERKHEINVSLAAGELRLDADPLRLEQILVNLLTNAAKYTNAGGRISLTAGHENGDIVIRLKDTGIGIAKEMLPRIFDLFAQGDRTIDRSEGGLGIGLTIVQRLVELHGGVSLLKAMDWGRAANSLFASLHLSRHAGQHPTRWGTLIARFAQTHECW